MYAKCSLFVRIASEEAEVINRLKDCEACCAAESVARMVKLEEPEAVGVPEIVPDEALRDRPDGKLPAAKLQV